MPLTGAHAGESPARSSRSTIALMYHALQAGAEPAPAADPHYTVDMDRFSAQLAACARLGGGAVSARDWLAGKTGVILTFDDGHASNHHLGLPALLAAGAGADFFVNPAQVGTAGYATWGELREMAEAGMSIQSHGLDHGHYLTELSPPQLLDELRRARLEIEAHVGRPVTLLAPPGGRSPRGLEATAAEAGYTHVLDSQPGTIKRGGKRTLGRFAITAGFELDTFESLLRGGRARLRAQARYAILALAKRAMGDRGYETLRRRLLRTTAAS
ncbi:MAG TPA: polysaccharide deacetylase family protein [Polyangia bacterium]|nr:polysaccharide deacetylase family protein [Polyangia bacterium]